MYLLFVPPLEFVFVSNFILSVYLCLCTIFVYSAILGKPYKSTVISNNNNNNNTLQSLTNTRTPGRSFLTVSSKPLRGS